MTNRLGYQMLYINVVANLSAIVSPQPYKVEVLLGVIGNSSLAISELLNKRQGERKFIPFVTTMLILRCDISLQ